MFRNLLLIIIVSFSVISVKSHKKVTTKYEYIMKDILQSNKTNKNENLYNKNNPTFVDINESKTFMEYYYDGVKAYLANDWEVCIHLLEKSIFLYHNYYEMITTCRITCEFDRERYEPLFQEDYEYRKFYEGLLYKALCLEKCRRKHLKNVPQYFIFSLDEQELFKRRKPYEYLQLCYFRDHEIEKAISATYTVLASNPGEKMMMKNIAYYSTLHQFNESLLIDKEDKKYSSFYLRGVTKYEEKEWKETIELLETAAQLWIQEHDKCRAFCEGPYEQGWLPDFVTSTSNHYVYSLRCKQNCTLELSVVNGIHYNDLFPSIFNYLQFAYFQVGKVQEAIQCTISYLLFYPKSEDMLSNLSFYKNKTTIEEKYYVPRNDGRKVYYRDFYEKELLGYIDLEFIKVHYGFDFTKQDPIEHDEKETEIKDFDEENS